MDYDETDIVWEDDIEQYAYVREGTCLRVKSWRGRYGSRFGWHWRRVGYVVIDPIVSGLVQVREWYVRSWDPYDSGGHPGEAVDPRMVRIGQDTPTLTEQYSDRSWHALQRRPPKSRRGPGRNIEADLVDLYAWQLCQSGHLVDVDRLLHHGSKQRLDLYDITGREIVEAKSHSDTNSVRHAVGQLYGYRRELAEGSGTEPKQLAALFPAIPKPEDLKLLQWAGIHCVYGGRSGQFERISPTHGLTLAL